MDHWFEVQHLDVERLLASWRWLCPGEKKLIARSVFGDLFLADDAGQIWWLDAAVGKLTKVAVSEIEFRNLLSSRKNREDWFGEEDEETAAEEGLAPNENQCIAFEIPLIFKESSSSKPYLIDVYEHACFLGGLNEQIAGLPEGA